MEKKIALIPKVMMSGALGPKEYGVVLTDQRTIFVLEKASKAMLVGVLGDALLTEKKIVDYENVDLDGLAAGEKNIVITHSSIQQMRIKKGLSSYTLMVDYAGPGGKSKKVKAILTPPSGMITQKKAEGVGRRAATGEYARAARVALERALPPTIAQRGEWDV